MAAVTIRVPNMRQGYPLVAQQVLQEGTLVAPRGQETRELLNTVIEVLNPCDSLAVGCGRNLNPAIAAVEALQLIGAFSDPDLVLRVSGNFKAFLDGSHFHGAYGTRVGRQLENVVHKLKCDRYSRQAVVTLWNPELDNEPEKRDYPCTVMFQFLLRRDELIMHTTMRSNDVWLGLPYDVFQFTQVQLSIAHVLDVQPGRYYHHAVSLHAYDRDLSKIEGLTWPTAPPPMEVYGIGCGQPSMRATIHRARAIWEGRSIVHETPSERWYRETLGPYLRAGS